MHRIPPDHPRYESLLLRQRMVRGSERNLAVKEGLLAHGRGEAFDYLLGERTNPEAKAAARAAAALLLMAKRPVLSVNGNVASLVPGEMVHLAKAVPGSAIEVNLFHRTEARARAIAAELASAARKLGVKHVTILSDRTDARLPGLSSDRAKCHRSGILLADVVLVPLEDGDRALALKRCGKKVVAIDLNPLSRTARAADITIVDNIVRAVPELIAQVGILKKMPPARLEKIAGEFDNRANLASALRRILRRLGSLSRQDAPATPGQ